MVAPLIVTVSNTWLGNDGSWSTFNIDVGTPPQSFRVLPSFQVQNVWLPIADECIKISADAEKCGVSRGAQPFAQRTSAGFHTNVSSTWEAIGLYELGLERDRGISGNGMSGFDTFRVSNTTLDRFPVTAYASPGFWLGQLGLSTVPLNFSETINSASLLVNLKDKGVIPSLTYGYQAGASYRETRVPGSLVLGGYDKSRATTPLTININADLSQALTVGLQDILVTNSFNGTLSMITTEPILAPLDSSITELWLPRSVCDRFEDAFGLEYDTNSGRYALSDATRNQLRQQKPTLTFTIGTNTLTGGNTTIIQFPYAAFDLQASFPIFANTTNYFPIRRADNESQYAIGRVFMQEAYIGVDYEQGIFNVSAARWNETDPNIVPLPAGDVQPSEVPRAGADGKSHLAGGAITGIVVGSIVAVAILVGLSWFVYKHKQRRSYGAYGGALVATSEEKTYPRELQDTDTEEVAGGEVFELPAKHGHSQLHEVERIAELDRHEIIQELASNRDG
ncbi:acid protease [Paraphaeosphaeria sporulosa]|uniref:Acid protease n=1 Tax=Paraphaeosphaeria sporulosa TaxID=1460663 RepID=A0A177CGL0_9PLEO|nr:acid protease [Paraphaeosphaeria sporulosa]OAG06092.1 acid protease [Paraphaeosphaeria sporulosa]